MNYNKYQTAANVGIEAKKSLLAGASEAETKSAEIQEFAFDTAVDYDKKQQDASKKYGNWKSALGVGAGILGFGLGLGPLAMAAMAGGGTLIGGKIGELKARGELDDFNWMKGGQKDLIDAMETQTYSSAISSAVMGGIGASTAQGASVGAEAGKVGAEAGKGYVNIAGSEMNKEFGKQFLQNLSTTGKAVARRGAEKAFGPNSTMMDLYNQKYGVIDGITSKAPIDPSVVGIDDIKMQDITGEVLS